MIQGRTKDCKLRRVANVFYSGNETEDIERNDNNKKKANEGRFRELQTQREREREREREMETLKELNTF